MQGRGEAGRQTSGGGGHQDFRRKEAVERVAPWKSQGRKVGDGTWLKGESPPLTSTVHHSEVK